MARIYKKGKTSLVSSILNILGLTAAFAALYIILVQVHHDLTYNKALKDSDQIYVLTKKEINQSEYSSYMNRPMGEYVISASPDIEAGGCGKITGNPIAVRVSDDQSPVSISISAMNKGARDVFGFELVAGNWDDLTGTGFALSESAAKRLGVQVGDVMKYYDGSGWQGISIVAIYKDMPKHSDLSSFEMLADMGDNSLDDWKEFSFNYFMKLRKGTDPKAITDVAMPVVKQFFSEVNGGTEVTDDDVKFGLYPVRLTDMYFDSNSYYAPGKAGNRTTTITLLVIAIFVVLIAFINYINFFFAMVPLRLRSINTRKILGSSRFQLVMSSVGESVLMVVIALGLAVAVVTLFRQSTLASMIDTSLDFGQNWGVVALYLGGRQPLSGLVCHLI